MNKLFTTSIIGLALALTSITGNADSKARGKVDSAVAGKLVKAEGKNVKAYSLKGSPKYYVLYYSATW